MELPKAQATARALLVTHGLEEKEWRFEFDYAKRRAGLCNYRRKVISLSKAITELATDEQVLDTILHEIAHALVGPGHGHGAVWRRTALQIGCNGKRCHSHATPEGKYQSECPGCGKQRKAHRRTQSACRACCVKHNHGRYTDDYKLVWSIV